MPTVDPSRRAIHWVLTGNKVRRPHRSGWTLLGEARCSGCGRVGFPQIKNGKLRKPVATPQCCAFHRHASRALPGKSTRSYRTWLAMRRRCNDQRCADFPAYGGRGITVCQEWNTSFLRFLMDMGEPADGKSLDRIDNDGNYEPGNCRWATQAEQFLNTRHARRFGTPIAALAREHRLSPRLVCRRIERGWPLREALGLDTRKTARSGRWLGSV